MGIAPANLFHAVALPGAAKAGHSSARRQEQFGEELMTRTAPVGSWIIGAASAVVFGVCSAPTVRAADAPPPSLLDSIKLSAWVDGGITMNPDTSKDFGSLFTDKANRLLLNQLVGTVEKDVDPNATGFDWGFKFQAMYGSDARYTHFLGEFDRSIHDTYQVDIVEANVSLHLPVLTEGGVDLKLGQYVTPLGEEVIAAPGNQFYSHSYIFQFGIPFKHTGGYAVAHVNSTLDLYAGLDTGVNTSAGYGDNNGNGALLAGFGLNNLFDGEVTVLALTHIGPENPSTTFFKNTTAVPFAGAGTINTGHDLRYLNDILVTVKPTQDWQFISEFNYIRDDGLHAIGYGAAQYAIYNISDQVSFGVRGEIWRDNAGAFVAYFPGNLDFVNAEKGYPNGSFGATTATGAPAPTTYGAITVGFNIKPTVPAPIAGLVFRPEIRYDNALNNTSPFNPHVGPGGTIVGQHDQVTLAIDGILSF
jgi:hypothetical protein